MVWLWRRGRTLLWSRGGSGNDRVTIAPVVAGLGVLTGFWLGRFVVVVVLGWVSVVIACVSLLTLLCWPLLSA